MKLPTSAVLSPTACAKCTTGRGASFGWSGDPQAQARRERQGAAALLWVAAARRMLWVFGQAAVHKHTLYGLVCLARKARRRCLRLCSKSSSSCSLHSQKCTPAEHSEPESGEVLGTGSGRQRATVRSGTAIVTNPMQRTHCRPTRYVYHPPVIGRVSSVACELPIRCPPAWNPVTSGSAAGRAGLGAQSALTTASVALVRPQLYRGCGARHDHSAAQHGRPRSIRIRWHGLHRRGLAIGREIQCEIQCAGRGARRTLTCDAPDAQTACATSH